MGCANSTENGEPTFKVEADLSKAEEQAAESSVREAVADLLNDAPVPVVVGETEPEGEQSAAAPPADFAVVEANTPEPTNAEVAKPTKAGKSPSKAGKSPSKAEAPTVAPVPDGIPPEEASAKASAPTGKQTEKTAKAAKAASAAKPKAAPAAKPAISRIADIRVLVEEEEKPSLWGFLGSQITQVLKDPKAEREAAAAAAREEKIAARKAKAAAEAAAAKAEEEAAAVKLQAISRAKSARDQVAKAKAEADAVVEAAAAEAAAAEAAAAAAMAEALAAEASTKAKKKSMLKKFSSSFTTPKKAKAGGEPEPAATGSGASEPATREPTEEDAELDGDAVTIMPDTAAIKAA